MKGWFYLANYEKSGFYMIAAIAELFFLSDRSFRSDHMEIRLEAPC